ncbi:MAG: hypothetical protein KGI33_01985 [Thaumarchaeota archaeon]|nr:hypothetical protein [Nitrososphaerota archaeon]
MMKIKPARVHGAGIMLGILALAAVSTFAPHAFAQQDQQYAKINSALGITPQDDPHGPLQMPAWAAGLAIAAAMSGIGAWSAIRGHMRH